MVVTDLPSTALTGVVHERMAWPVEMHGAGAAHFRCRNPELGAGETYRVTDITQSRGMSAPPLPTVTGFFHSS